MLLKHPKFFIMCFFVLLNQYLISIDDVKPWFGNLFDSAALQVVDGFYLFLLNCNIVNLCCAAVVKAESFE